MTRKSLEKQLDVTLAKIAARGGYSMAPTSKGGHAELVNGKLYEILMKLTDQIIEAAIPTPPELRNTIDSSDRLQKFFNDYVDYALKQKEYTTIDLPGFIIKLKEWGEDLGEINSLSDPILGFKSFYDLAADCPQLFTPH